MYFIKIFAIGATWFEKVTFLQKLTLIKPKQKILDWKDNFAFFKNLMKHTILPG